jgi:hypothetical protein
MDNILLDFYSGSHGHFLEYIINTYIFKGPKLNNIFTLLGTSHLPRKNKNYIDNRLIICGHFSEFNLPIYIPDKVVRITISEFIEQVCYQINVEYRAGDVPGEKKVNNIPSNIRTDKTHLRNQYYSKFVDPNNGYQYPKNWRWEVPTFEFPMGDLYDLTNFYIRLKNLADFLEHSFNPDQSLYTVWSQFMNMNHGFVAWTKCQHLLQKALANEFLSFKIDSLEQALLNSMLSKTIGIYSGKLFESPDYPTNTQEIYDEICYYINTFDSNF